MNKEISLFLKKLKKMPDFDRVKFVYLFGSMAEGRQTPMSDYDFAIYYEGKSDERFKFRLKMPGNEKFDVHIFQDLPLYIRINVLKGKLLYTKDEGFVYETAYQTIKEFNDYKKYYYDYIEMRPIILEK